MADSSPSSSSDTGHQVELDDVDVSDDSDVEYFNHRTNRGSQPAKRQRRSYASQDANEPNLKPVDSLGSIKSIELINFMCHSNFVIKLGPKVNFIIGRNGSGKSAILSAIMLVLGARSSVTSRGSSVAKFIKKGEKKAKISIVLCNWNGDQEQSYRYDDYGREIIVERTFAENSSSSYAVKSSDRKVISTKSKDLKEILRFFAIQVENPVVILNQEISRNFLNSKSAKDKYVFFMKATNLEELRSALSHTKSELERAKETRKEKGRVKGDMEAEAAELNIRVQQLHSIDAMKDKLKEKESELKWAQLKVKEDLMKEQSRLVEKLEKRLHQLQDSYSDLSGRIQQLNDEKNSLSEQSSQLQEDFKSANEDYQRLNDQIDSLKRKQGGIQAEIRQHTSRLNDVNNRIRALRESIEKESNKCQNDLEAQIVIRKTRLIEVKTDIEEAEAEIANINSTRDSLVKSSEEQRKKRDHLKYKKSKITQDIRSLKSRINDLQSVRTADFGSSIWKHAPSVKDKIDRAMNSGHFRVCPIGPLGAYISLTHSTCHVAVMSALRSLVNAYACDNNDDARKLRDLITQTIGARERCPQIIVRKFRSDKFNVEGNKVRHPTYKSLLDLMKISDANAFNVLIDKASLETVAFIPDVGEATNVLLNRHTVPANCRSAYSSDGTQFYPTTLNKVFRSYPYNGRSDNIFSRDVSEQIRHLQRELESLQETLCKIDQEEADFDPDEDENAKISELEAKLSKMKESLKKLRKERANLEEACEQDRPVELTTLQEELDENVQKKESIEKQLQELNEQKQDVLQKLDEFNDKRSKQDTNRNRLTKERATLVSQIREISDKIIKAQAESDVSKIEENKSQLQSEKNKLETLQQQVEEEIASIGGERIRTNKRPEEISKAIRELGKQIQAAEKEIGSREALTAKNNEVQQKLAKINETCDNLDKCIATLQLSLQQRRKLLYGHRARVVSESKKQFKRCLSQLNYEGDLNIDYGNPRENIVPTLTLSINPKAATMEDSAGDQGYKDTRSLSGGERSYSTVAFLLALWEGCNSPFCILDEVDVFMDMITRQVAMDLLVGAALEKGRQYIFLSPLPLIKDHINRGDIEIHHMPEPQRRVNEGRRSE